MLAYILLAYLLASAGASGPNETELALPKHRRLSGCWLQRAAAESSWRVIAGSEEGCKMQCKLRNDCKYFDYDAGVCWVSSLPFGMTNYIDDGDATNSCREVCVGTRRFCVFQQRLDGHVAFNRTWDEYVNGFGDNREFWTGLAWLNRVTSKPGNLTFRAELTSWRDQKTYAAEYPAFQVQNASKNFSATYNYTAYFSPDNVGDSMGFDNHNEAFSTIDRDNDKDSANACSDIRGGGGWWFFTPARTKSNPNGIMADREMSGEQYNYWFGVHDAFVSLKATRLLIQKPE